VLVNSIAGIAGLMARTTHVPSELPYWAIAGVAGGLMGSGLGSRRFDNRLLRRLLAAVLVIAAGKLILT
jgi:uncharacterized protein